MNKNEMKETLLKAKVVLSDDEFETFLTVFADKINDAMKKNAQDTIKFTIGIVKDMFLQMPPDMTFTGADVARELITLEKIYDEEKASVA